MVEGAEGLEVQVMETRKRVLGAEHPFTLTSMANLASTYRNQGCWKESEGLFVQVMEMRKRVLGAEHPDMLLSMATCCNPMVSANLAVSGNWPLFHAFFHCISAKIHSPPPFFANARHVGYPCLTLRVSLLWRHLSRYGRLDPCFVFQPADRSP
jgi:hypothetical protein